MYAVITTKSFDKAISKLSANWQKRIVAKIREVAANPYAPDNNLAKLQGREAYRLPVGGWRVIYEFNDGCLTTPVLDVGPRWGIY